MQSSDVKVTHDMGVSAFANDYKYDEGLYLVYGHFLPFILALFWARIVAR